MNTRLLLLAYAAVCPSPTAVTDAPGLAAVARLPSPEAMRLNGEGKQLYREERWNEARAKYQAALAADPGLLGAALNVACSYSRQRRYGEAAEEAAKLIRRAFVPWSREVEEAADLGILQDHQAAYALVQTARRETALGWGQQIREGVLFVARTKPPVRLGEEGVLVLGLNQEIFSWIPHTGRFLQVTAEDGRVLGFAASPDGRRIAYVLAGRLVRTPGQAGVLRGLSLRVLDLATMSLAPAVPIPGDVRRLQLWFATEPQLQLTDASGTVATFKLNADGMGPSPGLRPGRTTALVITGHGAELGDPYVGRGKCAFTLHATQDAAGRMRLQVRPSGRGKAFLLDTKYDAGLRGLPFPGTPGLAKTR